MILASIHHIKVKYLRIASTDNQDDCLTTNGTDIKDNVIFIKITGNDVWKRELSKDFTTFNGENANVTNAFAPKFKSTAMLSPFPLRRKGKISEIISQPIGPKDNCKTNFKNLIVMWYKMKYILIKKT